MEWLRQLGAKQTRVDRPCNISVPPHLDRDVSTDSGHNVFRPYRSALFFDEQHPIGKRAPASGIESEPTRPGDKNRCLGFAQDRHGGNGVRSNIDDHSPTIPAQQQSEQAIPVGSSR